MMQIKKIVNHRVAKNVGWIGLLQIANYIAPLLVLPYLSRHLTTDEFGSVMVSLATAAVALIITDYGFNLSATYKIAQAQEDIDGVNKIIGRVFTAKIALVLISVIGVVVIANIPNYSPYREVFTASILGIVSQAYQSSWLFQGLERMGMYVLIQSSTKFLYVFFVFTLILSPVNPSSVVWSWSIANCIGMFLAIWQARRLGFQLFNFLPREALEELKETSNYFWSRIAVAGYTSASSLIIGVTGLHYAAIYSVAEQGYKAGQAFTNTIAQAMYPYMAREKNWNLFSRVIALGFIVISTAAVSVSVFSEEVFQFLFGPGYHEAASVFTIMMCTLCINYLGVTLGYPALGAANCIQAANSSVYYGVIVYGAAMAVVLLAGNLRPEFVAISIAAAESVVLITRVQALHTALNR